jgi:hypothetical protein
VVRNTSCDVPPPKQLTWWPTPGTHKTCNRNSRGIIWQQDNSDPVVLNADSDDDSSSPCTSSQHCSHPLRKWHIYTLGWQVHEVCHQSDAEYLAWQCNYKPPGCSIWGSHDGG